ncbi:MAG TPA: VanZ family protein [Lacibacter sp.]|nr:VanZ family protein [Lacibacter sp.]
MKQYLQPYLISKWPTIIWSAIVFILLAMPGSGIFYETWFNKFQLDKLVHAFLFFVLTWLWIQYVKQGNKLSRFLLLFIVVTASLYGITMEFVQIYTGRDFSVGDMIADSAGALLAARVTQKISPGGNRGRNQN